jgi:hypothetical protein
MAFAGLKDPHLRKRRWGSSSTPLLFCGRDRWLNLPRPRPYGGAMITCVVHYTIDAAQIEAFERFARAWMRLVIKHGGVHHGYFLPAEGASDQAEALFIRKPGSLRALPRPVRR